MSERDEVDELLSHARGGERAAWERLLGHTYSEWNRLARSQLARSAAPSRR